MERGGVLRALPVRYIVLAALVVAAGAAGCLDEPDESAGAQSPPAAAPTLTGTPASLLPMEHHDGGFFSIDKPAGWRLLTGGACSNFAFFIRDPERPLRQIFYYGEVGPVYLTEAQRQIDYDYMAMGGYPIAWIDMPAIEPLTPSGFLVVLHRVLGSSIARSFMPDAPAIRDVRIISATPQPSPVPGGSTELIRALFVEDGAVGEGLFHVTVAPVIPCTGSPGGGFGYAFAFTGITAPQDEFAHLEPSLLASLRSFTLSQSYVDACLRQQAAAGQGILRAGRTLSETSDTIMEGWEQRNRVDDILSGKWSDAILGRERIYDPDAGTVYEVEAGFYEWYDLHRSMYEMNRLQPLPDGDWDLWMQAPRDGSAIR